MIDEMCLICESGGIESCLYRHFEDGSAIVVKSIFPKDLIKEGLIEKEIEKLINLRHPSIAAVIGFVFAPRSPGLKILGLSSESESLAEVIGASPVWDCGG
jgi:hypothetical protein